MRWRRAARVALVGMGAAGLLWAALALGVVNLSATARPSHLEKAVARAALGTAVRARAPRGRSAPTDPASLDRGRQAYQANCLVCHGVPGGEQSSIAVGLNPPVPDLAEPETQARTDGELFFLVTGGVRLTGMPGFERSMPEQLRWEVVGFLRALPKLSDDQLRALAARR